MDRKLEPRFAPGHPGEEFIPPGRPVFSWWAGQMAQTYRLAKFASILPGLATLRHLHLFFADVPRDEVPHRTPETVQDDLEELRAAWQEFEESKGDWSKGR
jgi:hypothetical protein